MDRTAMMSGMHLMEYDPDWPKEFAAERLRLSDALGGVARRIEHNGSTSVPGLMAKPIIDIQISVTNLHPMNAYKTPLENAGYTHVPHEDDAFCPFFHRPKTWPHTHHVHVVAFGGKEEARTLAFRDYLRDHADQAQEYAALKSRLAKSFGLGDPISRERYTKEKSEFIEQIIRIALASGYPCFE
jgi:GrpB-like predicted nucleotidyltransferase (UPF0157 family)